VPDSVQVPNAPFCVFRASPPDDYISFGDIVVFQDELAGVSQPLNGNNVSAFASTAAALLATAKLAPFALDSKLFLPPASYKLRFHIALEVPVISPPRGTHQTFSVETCSGLAVCLGTDPSCCGHANPQRQRRHCQ
jgi:hypothetical protein